LSCEVTREIDQRRLGSAVRRRLEKRRFAVEVFIEARVGRDAGVERADIDHGTAAGLAHGLAEHLRGLEGTDDVDIEYVADLAGRYVFDAIGGRRAGRLSKPGIVVENACGAEVGGAAGARRRQLY